MNNFKALMVHIIIGIITFLTYAVSSRFNNNRITICIFIFALTMYLLSGFFFENLGSKIRNLKSVSLVFILGVLIWTISIITIGLGRIGANPYWGVYCFYNSYFSPIMCDFGVEDPFINLFTSLIPSILIWLGIELKALISIRKLTMH